MKPALASTCGILRCVVAGVSLAAALPGPALGAARLFTFEHFGGDMPDASPIGRIPGWHAFALHGGAVVDYTGLTPGAAFPNLSHGPAGAGVGGVGYLVLGAGNCVSNVLTWLDCAVDAEDCTNLTIRFHSSNEAAESSIRVVVRTASQWYASKTSFHNDTRGWALHAFEFTPAAAAWLLLDTNGLSLGPAPAQPLSGEALSGIGVFGEIHPGLGKIRIDEFQVRSGAAPMMDPVYQVGCWIWADRISGQQTCRFWKLIEVPQGLFVNRARIRLTADNSCRAFIDGMEFGRAADWRRIAEYDLTAVFTPGKHVLAVEAYNDEGEAGLVAGVTVELEDGELLEIPSDGSWRVVVGEDKGWMTRKQPLEIWPAATLLQPFRDRADLPAEVRVFTRPPFRPPELALWQQRWFQIALLAFCGLAVALCLYLLTRLAWHAKAQQVLDRERARIARDIHDDFGGVLTQLVLLGETAQREASTSPESRAQFARVSETGRRLLRSIDEVVWLVNSQRDSLRDFESYVCRYTENFLRASSIRCRMEVAADIPEAVFDLAARRSFFLAIKEALNNVVRHSGATEVLLTMSVEHDKVRVTVQDNGKGFEPAKLDGSRNGLFNIAQRIKEVGGDCRVVSQPGAGCRVELTAPLSPARRAAPGWGRRRVVSNPALDKTFAL